MCEKREEYQNLCLFYKNYKAPLLKKSEHNSKMTQELVTLCAQLQRCVNRATGGSCCSCSREQLFCRDDQARVILKRTFEGKQYFVESDGQQIDCMFFPCTANEEVVIDSALKREYTQKPTVIMCNPNALAYQSMVLAPNAYWLNFFLKREINVICWNYRGYGESTVGSFEAFTSVKAKMDAEKVLINSISRLSL